MRTAKSILVYAVVVVLSCGWAAAQDSTKSKPAASSGPDDRIVQEIYKILGTRINPPDPGQRWDITQVPTKELEAALKKLEQALRAKQGRPALPAQRIEVQPDKKIELKGKVIKIIIGPDGKAQIVTDPDDKKAVPAPPAGSVDKKLDLILKQLDDLRRDVDAIKKKIDGKPVWQIVPAPGKDKGKKPGAIEIELGPAKDKKKPIDPNLQKRLDDLIRKALEGAPTPAPKDRKPEAESKLRDVPYPDARELRLELLRLQQLVDQLQRELNAKKAPQK